VSTVTVKPLNVAHTSPLTFNSEDFYADYAQSIAQGSFAEHDFKITGSVKPQVAVPADLLNSEWNEPLVNTEGVVVTTAAVIPSLTEPEPNTKGVESVMTDIGTSKSGGSLVLVVILGIVATFGGVGLVWFLKRGK